jgi:hypothetical protein
MGREQYRIICPQTRRQLKLGIFGGRNTHFQSHRLYRQLLRECCFLGSRQHLDHSGTPHSFGHHPRRGRSRVLLLFLVVVVTRNGVRRHFDENCRDEDALQSICVESYVMDAKYDMA